MFQKRLNGKGEGLGEINLTPLIDVCLVLVVILLVATPLAFESAIAVRNAAASGQTAEQKSRSERIEIRLIDDSSVEINRTAMRRSEISSRLQPLLNESTTRRVVISCAPGVSHGAFVNVLDQAKLSGAAEIAVLGD